MQMTATKAEDLGELIRDARDEMGLNQEEAARRAGLAYRTYGAYERAEIKHPAHDKVQAIAKALHIDELLSEEEGGKTTPWSEMKHGDPELPRIADEMGHPAKREEPSGEKEGLQEMGRHIAYELRDHTGDVQLRVEMVIWAGETKRETAGVRRG